MFSLRRSAVKCWNRLTFPAEQLFSSSIREQQRVICAPEMAVRGNPSTKMSLTGNTKKMLRSCGLLVFFHLEEIVRILSVLPTSSNN